MTGTTDPPKASKLRSTPPAFSSVVDDCERPACDDMTSMLRAAHSRSQTTAAAAAASKETVTAAAAAVAEKVECPPRTAALGKASWTLLHTMAAWYPDDPNEKDRNHMTNFMAAFARFYPCPWCATDFQQNLQKAPVKVESRNELCTWICEQHNLVNQKLGKPAYSCDMKALDERWRKSTKDECQK